MAWSLSGFSFSYLFDRIYRVWPIELEFIWTITVGIGTSSNKCWPRIKWKSNDCRITYEKCNQALPDMAADKKNVMIDQLNHLISRNWTQYLDISRKTFSIAWPIEILNILLYLRVQDLHRLSETVHTKKVSIS